MTPRGWTAAEYTSSISMGKMRRVGLVISMLMTLVIPAAATASDPCHIDPADRNVPGGQACVASPREKIAILKAVYAAVRHGPHASGRTCADVPWSLKHKRSCWSVVRINRRFATAVNQGLGNGGSGEWTYVEKFVRGGWRYVGGEGEGLQFACHRNGMAHYQAAELGITCRA